MTDTDVPPAEEIILYEKDPSTRIATITLNRPDQLNVPTIAARRRYADLLFKASIDDDVKVLVVRGVGDHLGTGADLDEVMAKQAEGSVLWEELGLDEDDDITMPPGRSYRAGASLLHWYGNTRSGCRTLQDFKKISILEVKGYCYGWHFYQAADADIVISSDDALFGHPAFRYVGYAPRMWQWAMMMGMRKFQEMVFTGRPFTADEMYDCNFVNSVVPRDDLEAEVEKYARACSRTRPTDTVFMQKVFFEIMKQHQGEYMGSLLSAWLESMGGQLRRRRRWEAGHAEPGDDGRRIELGGEGQRQCVPPRVAFEPIGSPPPRIRLTWPARLRLAPRARLVALERAPRGRPLDLDRGRVLHQAAGRRRCRDHQGRVTRRRSAAPMVGLGREILPEDDGALFNFLAASKRSAVADEGSAADLASLHELLGSADVVVWSRGSRLAEQPSLAPTEILGAHPHLIVTSITPFGLEGPWRDNAATEFTLQAWSGGVVGLARGLPDRAPVLVGGQIGEWLPGLFAAIGTLAARRRRSSAGELVDVSMLESQAMCLTYYPVTFNDQLGRPMRRRRFIPTPGVGAASDGLVGLGCGTGQQWFDFCVMVGHPEWMEDPLPFLGPDQLAPTIDAWIASHRHEVLDVASAFRIPNAPIANGATITTFEHFRERATFVANPRDGAANPRPPFRLGSGAPATARAGPAPRKLPIDDAPARAAA